MVAEIIGVLTQAITSLSGALMTFVISAFNTLIYVPAAGEIPGHLTGLAVWSLAFGGIALVLGIVNRFTRA